MKYLLEWKTRAGTFYIGQSSDGRFHPIYDDDTLGSYQYIWQATEDLAGGHTLSVLHSKTGIILDTSRLGISPDSEDWEKI